MTYCLTINLVPNVSIITSIDNISAGFVLKDVDVEKGSVHCACSVLIVFMVTLMGVPS